MSSLTLRPGVSTSGKFKSSFYCVVWRNKHGTILNPHPMELIFWTAVGQFIIAVISVVVTIKRSKNS